MQRFDVEAFAARYCVDALRRMFDAAPTNSMRPLRNVGRRDLRELRERGRDRHKRKDGLTR